MGVTKSRPDLGGRLYWDILAFALAFWVVVAFGLGSWVVLIGLTLSTALFVLWTVASYRSLRLLPNPLVELISVDSILPPQVREEWEASDAELQPEGFECVATLRSGDPHVAYSAVWVVRGRSLAAQSSLVTTSDGKPLSVARVVQTLGPDHEVVETTVGCPAQPQIPLPSIQVAHFDMLWTWRMLLEAHETRLIRLYPELQPDDGSLAHMDPVARVEEAHDRFLRALVEAGYIRKAAEGEELRPTIRGTLRWSVLSFPGFRWIGLIIRRARSEAFLHAAGLWHSRAPRWRHGLAMAGGLTAVLYGTALPFGLPTACFSYLGMVGVRSIMRGRGRPLGVGHVLLGGFVGLTLMFALMFGPTLIHLLVGYPTALLGPISVLGASPEILWPTFVAFVVGPAALLWGWSHVSYLQPLPVQEPAE